LLDPLIDRFEGRGWPRSTAIFLLGGLLLAALGVAAALLVPQLVRQAERLPEYVQDLSVRAVPLVESLLGRELPHTMKELASEAGVWASELAGKVGPAVGQFLVKAAGGTAAAVGTVLGLALVPVFLFYFLRDFDTIKGTAAELLPPRYRAQIVGRFSEIDRVLAAFVRGQLTVAAILAAIYATGLTAAGVKLGLVIGVIAGLASIVPVAGVAVGVLLTALAILVDWHDGSTLTVVGAAVTFGVGQVLEGSVITPRIVGEKVGLSAAWVMIAVLGFAEIFGFVGMLLAVPMAAVLKVVIRVLLERFRESQSFRASG
jgi:predicted PurR-regulated permease PerM